MFQRMWVAQVVTTGADIGHSRQSGIEVVPIHALRHAVAHFAHLGIDDEFGGRAMHASLVPASAVPHVICACHQDRVHGHRTFIAGLRVKRLGPAKRVRGPPRHTVEPRHLANHKIHQADLWGASHWRARFHAYG